MRSLLIELEVASRKFTECGLEQAICENTDRRTTYPNIYLPLDLLRNQIKSRLHILPRQSQV